MTINQVIYQVLDGTGLSTDDFPVSKRFAYNEIKEARTELIKQELNKNVLFDNASLQTIENVLFERAEENKYGVFSLRSKDPIPEAIEYATGIAIYVYLLNGRRLDLIDPSTIVNRDRKRFKLSQHVGYYFRNKRICITGYDDVDELEGFVEGHFKDPEVIRMSNTAGMCKNEKCLPVYEYDFDCPGHIERRVIEIAKNSVMRKLQVPTDNSNNSQFDSNVKSSPQPAQ